MAEVPSQVAEYNHTIQKYLHAFFYKNIIYKNVEPQIRDTIKNILTAQNV